MDAVYEEKPKTLDERVKERQLNLNRLKQQKPIVAEAEAAYKNSQEYIEYLEEKKMLDQIKADLDFNDEMLHGIYQTTLPFGGERKMKSNKKPKKNEAA